MLTCHSVYIVVEVYVLGNILSKNKNYLDFVEHASDLPRYFMANF